MRSLLLPLALLTISTSLTRAEHSSLWGKDGEQWNPKGRLPDFSYAGYESGNPIPSSFKNHKQISVTDFGAIPNDGIDDTQAFTKALRTKGPTTINIPAGKFILSNRIHIKTPNTILRGSAKNKTTLYFPKGLEFIDPKPTQNSGGTPTTSYSWSGGYLNILGSTSSIPLPKITKIARRGTDQLTLTSSPKTKTGDTILITQFVGKDQGIIQHLYSNDPGSTSKIKPSDSFTQFAYIKSVTGNTITIDRPLLSDVNPAWSPKLTITSHKVHHSGIKNLTIVFPPHTYGGHFKEVGYNAINISNTLNCFLKNITIENSDSGIFCNSIHSTLSNITLTAPNITPSKSRSHNLNGVTGHHGITLNGHRCLLENFHFKTKFIHDLTIVRSSGNVFMNGSGVNLAIDHHKKSPYANLFTNIDLGEGSRFLFSGGGNDIGRHSGAWQTFWNIQSKNPVTIPNEFGPKTMNFIGVNTPITDKTKFFLETNKVSPENLYTAQRKLRSKK